MKNILITSALSSELKEIKKEIKSLNLKDFSLSYLVSGMGNYNMIYSLTKFLQDNKNIDFVLNIWVCGYSGQTQRSAPTENVNIGHPQGVPLQKNGRGEPCVHSVIQIWRIKNIVNNKELIVPNFIEFSSIESIACSEKIIYDGEEIWEENFVDMESFWFEFVLEKFNLPRLILKTPVDKIWEETKNFDFDKAKAYLRENIDYKKLFEKIWEFLSPYPNLSPKGRKGYLEKYFQILNLTESQKTIFEKLYNKYEVLVWDDFESYLKNFFKNFKEKKLQKNDVKKFLKELENYLEDK